MLDLLLHAVNRTRGEGVFRTEEWCAANREDCCGPTRGVLCCEQRRVLWSHQRSDVLRTEKSAVAPPEERSLLCLSAANRGECCVSLLQTDNVAAPNRNLSLIHI